MTFTAASNFLAASAMAMSSSGVVVPPHMRGMTEYVPSFWMLAWLRSLTKRDWPSSRYSSGQSARR